jgi:hypothetical protein
MVVVVVRMLKEEIPQPGTRSVSECPQRATPDDRWHWVNRLHQLIQYFEHLSGCHLTCNADKLNM